MEFMAESAESDFKRSLTQTEVNKLRLRKEKDTN
jgi:hypothetical protein